MYHAIGKRRALDSGEHSRRGRLRPGREVSPIDTDDDELTLRRDGPPAAGELVDRQYRYLIGNDPIDVLAGIF